MNLGERSYARSDLAPRIGNRQQLGGARRIVLDDGPAKGILAYDIDTGSGLRVCLLPDRGMDISLASYNGINLVFLTPNGEVHPACYDAAGSGWLHTFFGGLLTTCGLTTLGAPGNADGEALGLHGRITTIPACQVQDLSHWEGDDWVIEIRGVLREARVFGTRLVLERTLRTRVGQRSLELIDRVTNEGFESAPFTILYHINAGFPLLDASSVLALTAEKTEAHDDHSRADMALCKRFTAPQPGFREQNFLHLMGRGADGKAHAAMLNPDLCGGLGLALRFDPDELPYLNEWKMMGQGDYVVGIEPCNAPCANRGILQQHGLLPRLEPGETQEKSITIDILVGADELAAYAAAYDREIVHDPFTTL